MKFMRTCCPLALAVVLVLPGGLARADQTLSGGALRESVQASGHAAASVAHGIAASGRAVLGVSAVPLAISGAALGSVGAVSAAAGAESARAANAPIGMPLEITDETITVMPPSEALKPGPPAQPN